MGEREKTITYRFFEAKELKREWAFQISPPQPKKFLPCSEDIFTSSLFSPEKNFFGGNSKKINSLLPRQKPFFILLKKLHFILLKKPILS